MFNGLILLICPFRAYFCNVNKAAYIIAFKTFAMKKEPVILFPDIQDGSASKNDAHNPQMVIRPRDFFVIGPPSSRYYQFIHHSLQYHLHQVKDLEILSKMNGAAVMVTSILTMKDGSVIAALKRPDNKFFFDKVDRLFAKPIESVLSKELVPMDLHSVKILKDKYNL